ncbi:MAG: GTP-binding protein [Prevotella sp.]|uniref:GTP-binding protein n=1 Tax=Prevotella sp. TaxID=59823 RepID=UPI002A26728A|nr:GTP-binding protein [Prevotella sp.]MDD7318494.1 GTP-binding protein [Prevotellaceae bacterium]MDY4020299.1 GTP-binding protein [Prevotella sp.]
MKQIPVLLLTGYLGSGKTTLLNRILNNRRNIKFAVIVNDIGEVNIDAELIQKGGVVSQGDDSLIALQNGCICCTLKTDLIAQINDIMTLGTFDYIAIEASGICEPEPIAQTVCSMPYMGQGVTNGTMPRLDCIVTVVDALRMQSEFACGERLTRGNLDEEDIENLIIQQVEFCNIVLLNKASEVKPEELRRVKVIIRTLQPKAEIIECDYADIELEKILNTGMFDFEHTVTSARWIQEIERPVTEEEEHEAKHAHGHHHEHHHEHDGHDGHHRHHHHYHHHDDGEAEEYGITTFVYYRRQPFNINNFDQFVARKWPKEVIRTKGVCYFAHNRDMSYLFEQAGVQKTLQESGLWYATARGEELEQLMEQHPDMKRDWDDTYGDRMIKLVFIGQRLDREEITRELDECLEA